MDFIARALRGWSVPLVLPVAQSARSFDPDGHLVDEGVAGQLRKLGGEVVRAARQFQAEGTCDYADHRQFPSVPASASSRPADQPPDQTGRRVPADHVRRCPRPGEALT